MFDMMKMMGKFKEAQDKMKEIKNQLDTIKVDSESGEFIKEKTGNLMPNIPGFDIGNLFK